MKESMPFEAGVSRLAIDVGGVISQNDTDAQCCGDLASYLAHNDSVTPTMECTMACRQLVQLFGPDDTFILSKCGRNMQLATVAFLSRSIERGGNFFERTGLKPRNVFFCTKRTGGTGDNIRLVPLDPKNTRGPRVAVGNVGKGAVARKLRLTHMIDDRHDCLLSFIMEGHLFQTRDFPGALVHFGPNAAAPITAERIEAFMVEKAGIKVNKKRSQKLVWTCEQLWVPAVNEWPDVLKAFGIAEQEEQDSDLKEEKD